jgi:hypothetical protein
LQLKNDSTYHQFQFLGHPICKQFSTWKSCQQTELSFEWEQQKLRAGTWQTLDCENRRESNLLSVVQDDICLLFHLFYILCFIAKTEQDQTSLEAACPLLISWTVNIWMKNTRTPTAMTMKEVLRLTHS